MDHDDSLDITDELDNLSIEQVEDAARKAKEIAGVEHLSHEELAYDEGFIEELENQLKLKAVGNLVDELIAKGYVEAYGMNEDGEILYQLTEAGKKRVEDSLG